MWISLCRQNPTVTYQGACRVPVKSLKFSIANTSSNAAALAEFFRANLNEEYISHSEMQSYRALSAHRWAPDVANVLETEIAARLGPPLDRFSAAPFWQGVVLGHRNAALVALAMVTLSRKAVIPFGIIEDIVVDAEQRGNGYGAATIRWIDERFCDAGLARVFLESGLNNTSAHHFFEKLGFEPISIVMMREL